MDEDRSRDSGDMRQNRPTDRQRQTDRSQYSAPLRDGVTRGQSNLTKGRIVAPKIHARSPLTKPKVVFLK